MNTPPYNPMEAFRAWEKLRWIFNIAVGLTGILGTMVNVGIPFLPEVIGAILYGLFANVFYCLGFVFEMADQHYLKGGLGLHRARTPLFLIGTILSMLLTFWATYIYGFMMPFMGP
jgi:hypothetical protein